MKESINFTKAALNALPTPKSGKKTYYDSNERGLCLYVTATGHKSFFVRKKVGDKQKRIIIGPFPERSVDQARKEAQRIKLEIITGKDPQEEKKKPAMEQTFGDAFVMFMERHAKENTKTWKEISRIITGRVPHLFSRPLSSITKVEMQHLHERIGKEHGKYRANRVLAWIRTIYNKAISWGWEGTNPAIDIEKFREQKRDRFVSYDELPKLMNALENELNTDMRDFFLLCLYTGARCGNVAAMEWDDIDFTINEWRIPDTKNGEPVRIPLIEQALEILHNRNHIQTTSKWVLPSKTSKSGHLEEPKTAWARILARAGLKNLRIHDLRLTCASYQAIAGTSLTIIGKSLGHKSPQSTAIYARLSNDPVRKSMQSAFDFYAKKEVS
jgi:integrase